ncbi:MAG: nucleotidyltransferase family protein [Armatimonadetes bacterium]|nr:nucleotidyltransferase family protein [Armatimonadota bacterium]MDE2205121.1 nucleotidyltransferase family protein [Armatimonadota bacterium]
MADFATGMLTSCLVATALLQSIVVDGGSGGGLLGAVLPAGGRLAAPMDELAGHNVKALVRIAGATLLETAIAACRQTARIGPCVVAGPPEALAEAVRLGVDAAIAEADTGPANILLAARRLQEFGAERALILATDLPFVTAADVTAFLASCPPGAEVAAGLVGRTEMEALYPGLENRWVRLRSGHVTMTSAFVVDLRRLETIRVRLEAAFAARKSQPKMAMLVGIRAIVGLYTGRLTVEFAERRVGRILGCTVAAVPAAPPALAFDIDTPPDLMYARSYAAQRGRSE